MSVTIAKRGEANLVSHIPAKSSHGAANSRVMRPKARPRGSERPTTTRDKAAAKIPYIGTCTWVSWISRSVSTAWTSGRVARPGVHAVATDPPVPDRHVAVPTYAVFADAFPSVGVGLSLADGRC